MNDPAGPIRVLHVDDDPEFAEVVATFLEREDDRIAVRTAPGPEAGLSTLAESRIDCVVSDYEMPPTDGIEFLRRVREEYPDLPFVLYTGKGSEDVAADAISAGVTDYLQKGTGSDQYAILANRIKNAVAARRSATEAEQSRHRLAQILKTVPSCVVQLDYEGRFVFANDRAVEVLGLEESDLTDRSYNDPEWQIRDLHGDPIPDEQLPFRQVRDSGDPLYGYRHRIEWPDGTHRILSVNGAPLFEDGEVDSVVFSLTDVTGRVQQRRELERQNERLGEFASLVGHDLRTPLRTAAGSLELAREDCDGEHLDGVARALDRMDALVEDLLTVAREGETVTETEPVDLGALARECWQAVETGSASLVVDDPGTVAADRSRLRRAFENLLRNAVEHGSGDDRPESDGTTGDGDPAVTVTVGATEEGFYVADDGPGIPGGRCEDVFEAGYTTSPGGVGFGLRIVRQVVEAHGWLVRVVDSDAGGARFEVTGVKERDG